MQRNTARMWSLDALLNPTQSALTSLVAALPTWATLQTQMSFNTLAILPCYSAFCGLWLYPNFPARDEATMVRCRYAFRPSLVFRLSPWNRGNVRCESTQYPIACSILKYQNPQQTRNYPTARPASNATTQPPSPVVRSDQDGCTSFLVELKHWLLVGQGCGSMSLLDTKTRDARGGPCT